MTTALETFELPRQTVDSVGEVRVRTTLLRTHCGPKGLWAQDLRRLYEGGKHEQDGEWAEDEQG
jgi:hypothetical protein